MALLCIVAGAFVWFSIFSFVPGGMMAGPLVPGRLLYGALRLFDRHAYTAGMLPFLFFCGFALL